MKPRGESSAGIVEFLCSLPLFAGLNESSLQLVAALCRFRRVSRGEILFFDSDACESAYVVRSGSISIVLNSPDGREMVIDEVHPGEMFGETELLTGKSRIAAAIARSQAELLLIPSEALLCLLDAEPRFTRRILECTAQHLQDTTRRLMALAFMNAQARLARNLLALDDEQRDIGFVTVSQDELARGAGLIRQTVAKALGEWRRKGWLLTGRGRIVVLNRKALEQVEMGALGGVVSSK